VTGRGGARQHLIATTVGDLGAGGQREKTTNTSIIFFLTTLDARCRNALFSGIFLSREQGNER
jgi:hypothetical protein